MAIEYNEKEKEALLDKMTDSVSVVKCPRCGKELIYHSYLYGDEVTCETENCLHIVARGI